MSLKNERRAIFLDRDGTLIYDKKYYFGSQKNWRSLIKILPYVIDGLRLLKKIRNSKIYIITNQPGVAIKNFPFLTLKRAHEVCRYVLKQLEKRNVKVETIELKEKDIFLKLFSSLVLADWTAYHTAIMYGLEPEQVPMIEEFKGLI